MSLSVELYEATYEADAKVRAQANEVWDSIVRYIKSLDGDYSSLHKHSQTGGFIVTWENTKLPRGLYIILAPDGAQSGIGKAGSGGKTVIVLGDVLYHPHDTTDFHIRILRAQGAFIHEFTHYLDQQRYKGKYKSQASRRAADSGNLRDYFGSPEEFNAWYQEAAEGVQINLELLLKAFKKLEKDKDPDSGPYRLRLLGRTKERYRTFDSFLDYVLREDKTKAVIKAIKGTKWQKKWTKRMYGLYRAMKSKLEHQEGRV